jgi:hypothetical protein
VFPFVHVLVSFWIGIVAPVATERHIFLVETPAYAFTFQQINNRFVVLRDRLRKVSQNSESIATD